MRLPPVTTVRRCTGRSIPSNIPLQPRSLPFEIQIRILQQTDLVAPYDLQWTEGHGFVCRARSPSDELTDDLDQEQGYSFWQRGPLDLNPCSICIATRDPCPNWDAIVPYGASASQCECWRFPAEMFLVSKAYHKEAMRIFYSMNHFYVMPAPDWEVSPAECPAFIEQMPSYALPYLRSLQLILPYFDDLDFDEWVQQSWTGSRWCRYMELLAKGANLPRLTLTIDQSMWRDHVYHDVGLQAQADETAWRVDQKLIEPFQGLRGLKNLFVHLRYPLELGLRTHKEGILERRVMGEDYDAEKSGKYAHKHRFYVPRRERD